MAAIFTSLVLAVVAAVGAARINGLDRLAAANIAFSVVARGEFALILVALATAAGLDERLDALRRDLRARAGGGQPGPRQPFHDAEPAHPGSASPLPGGSGSRTAPAGTAQGRGRRRDVAGRLTLEPRTRPERSGGWVRG